MRSVFPCISKRSPLVKFLATSLCALVSLYPNAHSATKFLPALRIQSDFKQLVAISYDYWVLYNPLNLNINILVLNLMDPGDFALTIVN